jgi:hypothetical protein
MDNIHKYVTDGQKNIQFFSALSYECLLFCFARLDLATDKLPKETSRFVRRALAYHELIALPNKGCYYLSHAHYSL